MDDLLKEIIDDFSTENKTLLYHRSQIFNYINKEGKKI